MKDVLCTCSFELDSQEWRTNNGQKSTFHRLWEQYGRICKFLTFLTLSVLTLWNTSPVRGGADLPTLELWLLEDVFIIFF